MSRIGKKPIVVPRGVTFQVGDGEVVIKGPKGSLTTLIPQGIKVKAEGAGLHVGRERDEKADKAKHGMVRALIQNSVVGVTEGWKRELEIVGIGYKATKEGGSIAFNLGFSHVKSYRLPDGIAVDVDPKQTRLTVTGIDRQRVGQTAAEIRALRPPEPYKGKGIKYVEEVIKKKVGKTGA